MASSLFSFNTKSGRGNECVSQSSLREEIDVSHMVPYLLFQLSRLFKVSWPMGWSSKGRFMKIVLGKLVGSTATMAEKVPGRMISAKILSNTLAILIHQFGSENTTDGRHLQGTGTEAIGRKKMTK